MDDGRLLAGLAVGVLAAAGLARRHGSAWGHSGRVDEAIEAWLRDEVYNYSSSSVSTDGYVLKSYNLVIGETVEEKGRRVKVVWDKPASHTTRTHICKAVRAGGEKRNPADRTALTITGPKMTVLERPPPPRTAKDIQFDEDQEWRRRGPWDLEHGFGSDCDGVKIVNGHDPRQTKCFQFRPRSNAYEKAVHECAVRNRKIAQKREGR